MTTFAPCPDKPGMVQHECPRYGGITYVSDSPYVAADGYFVPGCGHGITVLTSPEVPEIDPRVREAFREVFDRFPGDGKFEAGQVYW